jgi:hypothetical protein
MKPSQPPRAERAKRPYRKPVLRLYGNLRAITGAVGFMGASDGGTMVAMKMTR